MKCTNVFIVTFIKNENGEVIYYYKVKIKDSCLSLLVHIYILLINCKNDEKMLNERFCFMLSFAFEGIV